MNKKINNNWYYIDIKYACFGIIENNGIIVKAAPICKWMIGKTLSYIKNWVNFKRGKTIKLNEKINLVIHSKKKESNK